MAEKTAKFGWWAVLKNRARAARDGARVLILSPIFAAIVTVLVIAAGALVSLFADEIKNAWPLHPHARGPIVWPAFWSWIVAIAASLTFFFRQQADQSERTKAQKELVDQAKSLELLVRTMPPANFVDSFAALHRAVDESVSGTLGTPVPPFDLEMVEKAARLTLWAIAALAKFFDGDRADGKYAANVMTFRPTAAMSEQEMEYVMRCVRFCEPGTHIKSLRGILDLEPSLSATTDSKELPDANLPRFALPVPFEVKVNRKYKALPGAPIAFLENKPDTHEDFGCLRTWCDVNADLTESVKADLDAYLESQSGNMRSFISIPLVLPENPGEPFAVLNIHSRQVGLLRNHADAVAQFVGIITPLQSSLVRLLRARESSLAPVSAAAAYK